MTTNPAKRRLGEYLGIGCIIAQIGDYESIAIVAAVNSRERGSVVGFTLQGVTFIKKFGRRARQSQPTKPKQAPLPKVVGDRSEELRSIYAKQHAQLCMIIM